MHWLRLNTPHVNAHRFSYSSSLPKSKSSQVIASHKSVQNGGCREDSGLTGLGHCARALG
eukprot:6491505-Amphidinium_carterae.1